MKANADRIVSISAIVVSLATLIMILYQTNLMRQEQRASVMPSLMIGYGKSDTLNVVQERIWLKNNGLGPAFIEKMVVIDSTGTHTMDLFDYFKDINDNKNIDGVYRFVEGLIVPENDGRPLYNKFSNNESPIILSNHFEFPYQSDWSNRNNPNKAIIEVYYHSVYKERFKVRSNSPIPMRLD